ncbi:hypothetical protein HDV06_004582 [Boothiomyces sp. JEL0866]|nr:hypothetical protein HDV06_004582 [Boothiomyces sp. JEL0866]
MSCCCPRKRNYRRIYPEKEVEPIIDTKLARNLTLTERFNKFRQSTGMLASKSVGNLSQDYLCIYVLTFNMNGRLPTDNINLLFGDLCNFKRFSNSHLVVIGTQECEKMYSSKQQWEQIIDSFLEKEYVKLQSETLIQLHLVVYVKKPFISYVGQIQTGKLATGIGNVVGNKGAIGIAIQFATVSILLVNAHMTAHEGKVLARNKEFHRINSQLPLFGINDRDKRKLHAFDRYDYTFFLGDLNYRVKMNRGIVERLLKENKMGLVLEADELNTERAKGSILKGFKEGPIKFQPTFKFDVEQVDTYNKKKQRVPSWTDRILFKHREYIYVNTPLDKPALQFRPNKVQTSKYTLVSFLPKNIFEQFHGLANFYFLGLVILQALPIFADVSLIVAAMPDAFEDYKRHVSDNMVNRLPVYTLDEWQNTNIRDFSNSSSGLKKMKFIYKKIIKAMFAPFKSIFSPKPDTKLPPVLNSNDYLKSNINPSEIKPGNTDHSWKICKWKDIKVGDFVLLQNNNRIPADILIISTSEPDSTCFVETKNLDGETNLKIKKGVAEFSHIKTPEDCKNLKFRVDAEVPNPNLYTFNGSITVLKASGEPQYLPIGTSGLLLRGCILRNTTWLIGVAIYTGPDTKIMLNSGPTPSKRSQIDRQMNPLSYLINQDLDMYDEESGQSALPKSWNLCDDLGQIEYIFSDKTGTLTSNIMEFKKASINGQHYGITGDKNMVDEDKKLMLSRYDTLYNCKYMDKNPSFIDSKIPLHLGENSIQSMKIREFFTLLAVCHTVLVEKSDDPKECSIAYRAQSPDEAALVSAAKNTGFVCLNRTDNKVEVDIMGQSRVYTILNIVEFTSDRKRMSVIARRPEGDLVLLCKGADSVIYDRLDPNENMILKEQTSIHLELFANEGLRTLCLAYKLITEDEYREWNEMYRKAQNLLVDREIESDKIANLMEKNLNLMGATAIEDKLQDGVPQAIEILGKAGIKLWVLTGDKVETAINIGFSCNLLKDSMMLIIIQSKNTEDTKNQLVNALKRFWDDYGNPITTAKGENQFGLVIDGNSLKFALEPSCSRILLELGCRCKAVLCCRVSPLQKALVVKLVREGLGAMCLAIGDGANDVSMIQEANIGVGISGKEGLQAVMASDYAISQFRFVAKLLLVHGRWAYVRASEECLNFFYKNVFWLFILFWHQFYCGFSANLVIDFTYSMFFNTLFSVLPTVVLGTFDQDINSNLSMKTPQLYLKGIKQELFTSQRFWLYLAYGLYQSIICYFAGVIFQFDSIISPSGYDSDGASMGTIIAFTAIFTVNIFQTCNWYTWNWIAVVSFLATIGAWLTYVILYALDWTSPVYGFLSNILQLGDVLGLIALLVITSLLPNVVIKYTQQLFYPTDTDLIQEIQKFKLRDVYAEEMIVKEKQEIVVESLSAKTTEKQLPKIVVQADGFGISPDRIAPSAKPRPLKSDDRSRTSSMSSISLAIKTKIQKATDFIKQIGQDENAAFLLSAPKMRNARAGSLMYMGNSVLEPVPNTGYAFSHDSGMEEIITPKRFNYAGDLDTIEELSDARKPRNMQSGNRFREFSKSIQSVFGFDGGLHRNSSISTSISDISNSSRFVPRNPPNMANQKKAKSKSKLNDNHERLLRHEKLFSILQRGACQTRRRNYRKDIRKENVLQEKSIFLPKNLFEQFHGLANFYFLGLVILQVFPLFEVVGIVVTALPIIIIIATTAIKDGLEDLKRHMADDSVNNAHAFLLDNWANLNYENAAGAKFSIASIIKDVKKKCSRIFKGLYQRALNALNGKGEAKGDKIPEVLNVNDYIKRSSVVDVTHSPKSEVWRKAQWKNIRVGDFILLRNNDSIPADLMIVSSSEPEYTCFVETKNLDGETNLKIKRGLPQLAHIKTPEDCKRAKFTIEAEIPNANLYTFNGSIMIPSESEQDPYSNTILPLGPSSIVLRGCILRNTSWLIGIAIYTGVDTKIMLNSGPTPSKRSQVDRQINPQIILNVVVLITMCGICAIISGLYAGSAQFENYTYLGYTDNPYTVGFITFFQCLIIFQNIIPIALYISLDVTKTVMSYFISLDLDMYDEDSDKSAQPKSWNLCDDLGQIEYIFSDKTGTLTSNVMEFKKASINGQQYGMVLENSIDPVSFNKKLKEERDLMLLRYKGLNAKYIDPEPGFVDSKIPLHLDEKQEQGRKIREFFTCLAICHTVLVEKPENDSNKILYRAQSPDEAALVSAAKNTGFACLNRTDNKVDVDILGVSRTYTILNIMEFNSDRKRMSVIVRRPEGEILLFCKGADSVIYERLDKSNPHDLIETTSQHLAIFANNGLRTLCLAYRVISEDDYHEWNEKYRAAQALIENREAECDLIANRMEQNLILMGATAIEDKLQDGVPDAIATLAKAGIKLWVLTGDKVETAINIGFSCNLLQKSMVLIVIQSSSPQDTFDQLKEALKRFWDENGHPRLSEEYKNTTGMATVIDGASLKFALESPCKDLFLELGCRCKAVLCCRVSPLQKAMVVKLVREGLGAMCLAIGDGANDVSMIQEANIGIGISGKEGLQAVMASDYAISQFRFLTNLIPRAVIKYVQQLLYPSDTDLLQETQHIKSSIQEIEALSPQAVKLPVQDVPDKDHVTRSHDNLPAIVIEKEEHPTDGFATPTAKEDLLPRHKTLSAGPKKTIHKSSDFKNKVQRASNYFNKHLPHLEPKHKPHRAGSLVYMGSNPKEVTNNGFAFSQDEGMQDIITPRRAVLDVIEENEVPKMKKRQPSLVPKLRNLSRSFQTVFGIQPNIKPTSTPNNSTNSGVGNQDSPEANVDPNSRKPSSVPPSTDQITVDPVSGSQTSQTSSVIPSSKSDNFLSGFKQVFRIPSRDHGDLHGNLENRALHAHHGHGVKKHHGSHNSLHNKPKKEEESPDAPEIVVQVASSPTGNEKSVQNKDQNSDSKLLGPESDIQLLSSSFNPSLATPRISANVEQDHRPQLSQVPQLSIHLPSPGLSQIELITTEPNTEAGDTIEKESKDPAPLNKD